MLNVFTPLRTQSNTRSKVRPDELLCRHPDQVRRVRDQRQGGVCLHVPRCAEHGVPGRHGDSRRDQAAGGDRRHPHRWCEDQGAVLDQPRGVRPTHGERPADQGTACPRSSGHCNSLPSRVPVSSRPSRPTRQTTSRRSPTCARSPSSTRSTPRGPRWTPSPSSRPRRTAT